MVLPPVFAALAITEIMNFETQYKERVEILLINRERGFDLAIKELLQNAARDHELGGGNTIRRITECCTSQTEEAVTSVVTAFSEMIDTYDKRISNNTAWGIVEPFINELVSLSEEKKMKAMKTSQGVGLNESIINASSLEEKYRLLKSEAKFSLDKALSAVKTKRGKTLKDRIVYHLYNSWLYLIGAALVVMLVWLMNG
jgi:hypothetical protein